MSENIQLNASTNVGDVIAADDIGGVKHQRNKLSIGANNSATDAIGVTNGMNSDGTGVLAVGFLAQYDDTSPSTVTENSFGPPRMSSNRALYVEGITGGIPVPVALSTGTVAITGAIPAGTNNIGDVDVLTINGSAPAFGTGVRSTSVLRVTVATDDVVPISDNSGSLTVDNGGTFAVQAAQSGTWTVQPGNTANTTAWKVDGSAVTQPVSMATNTPVGNVTHGNADSGGPIKIGGRAETTFQAAESDGDRVDWQFDVYGVPFVRDDHPNKWSFHYDGSTALSSQVVSAAAGAGLSNYITDIFFSLGSSAATNKLTLKETSTTIFGPIYLENVNGRSAHIRLKTPKKCTANVDLLAFTGSSAVHTVDILGYIAP